MTADPPTTRLGLYKSDPDGDDLVNYVQDLGQNLDKIDLAVGFQSCTSSTRPSSPYNGKAIRETDTGRTYLWDGSAWRELANTQASPTFTAGLATTRANPTDVAIATADDGDAQRRFGIRADGLLQWGTGAATEDTNLYRSAANTLKTDDSLLVAGDLTVTGGITAGGIGAVTLLRKAADTARTTATKADDPDLTVTVTAGRIYELTGLLIFNTTDESGADLSSTLTVPASCAGYVNYIGQDTPIASPAGTPLMVVSSLGTPGTQTFGAVTTAHYAAGSSVAMSGIVRPTVTGTFAFNWARSGGSGTVTLKADSFIRLTRLV